MGDRERDFKKYWYGNPPVEYGQYDDDGEWRPYKRYANATRDWWIGLTKRKVYDLDKWVSKAWFVIVILGIAMVVVNIVQFNQISDLKDLTEELTEEYDQHTHSFDPRLQKTSGPYSY